MAKNIDEIRAEAEAAGEGNGSKSTSAGKKRV
jgi:hypothetical protein